MICFVVEVIGANAVHMIVGGVAVMVMISPCRMIPVPDVAVCFSRVCKTRDRQTEEELQGEEE